MAETKIFARLKADHDRHRDLLARIDETHGDSDERRTLFEAFRVEVTAHAASEEMSLYATMLAKPELRDDAQHSVSEHKEIEDFLTELYEMDFASTGWLTRFRTMKDRYLHHIDEEEEEMFPEAEKDLSEAKKQELLAIFEKEKPKEKAKAAEEEPSSEHERA
ncbi:MULTISPECIES: hemerythrin domain-containing protein [Sphingopyxis]|jgi:hemerythrin superfamily protein|uniref:Hemerythrin HHE cation binding domain-containing protein n=2 Tax=Sphingopyxis terrae TaxID=33052 RepID=A0A1Y6FPI4_9SPHN|nr:MULTISPECIES: hemerythrin domain-containing protein [Sphingopyxis]KAB2858476.1 MAG: hemerythrin domain-containing protein [Sphingopyxis terrae]AMU93530.1 hemerythrin [Sphingopyxis terrae subsp. terrae NBRC 15098]ENY83097.1 hemerythrin HHE cation binding protein [Sphingopyxis sp. MC1]KTE75075.1 hemerythrin [Sphingopyxis sp. A083]MBD3746778.1 hemerythrin domain-containing protein [Sphingopyxis terrae]